MNPLSLRGLITYITQPNRYHKLTWKSCVIFLHVWVFEKRYCVVFLPPGPFISSWPNVISFQGLVWFRIDIDVGRKRKELVFLAVVYWVTYKDSSSSLLMACHTYYVGNSIGVDTLLADDVELLSTQCVLKTNDFRKSTTKMLKNHTTNLKTRNEFWKRSLMHEWKILQIIETKDLSLSLPSFSTLTTTNLQKRWHNTQSWTNVWKLETRFPNWICTASFYQQRAQLLQ